MTLQLSTRTLRLALCAVICLVALQTWETTHDHAQGGVTFECQVCSSPVDLALPAPAAVTPVAVLVGRYCEQHVLVGDVASFTTYNPRAPPAFS